MGKRDKEARGQEYDFSIKKNPERSKRSRDEGNKGKKGKSKDFQSKREGRWDDADYPVEVLVDKEPDQVVVAEQPADNEGEILQTHTQLPMSQELPRTRNRVQGKNLHLNKKERIGMMYTRAQNLYDEKEYLKVIAVARSILEKDSKYTQAKNLLADSQAEYVKPIIRDIAADPEAALKKVKWVLDETSGDNALAWDIAYTATALHLLRKGKRGDALLLWEKVNTKSVMLEEMPELQALEETELKEGEVEAPVVADPEQSPIMEKVDAPIESSTPEQVKTERQKNPETKDLWRQGLRQFITGDLADVVSTMEDILKIDPHDIRAREYLLSALKRLKKEEIELHVATESADAVQPSEHAEQSEPGTTHESNDTRAYIERAIVSADATIKDPAATDEALREQLDNLRDWKASVADMDVGEQLKFFTLGVHLETAIVRLEKILHSRVVPETADVTDASSFVEPEASAQQETPTVQEAPERNLRTLFEGMTLDDAMNRDTLRERVKEYVVTEKYVGKNGFYFNNASGSLDKTSEIVATMREAITDRFVDEIHAQLEDFLRALQENKSSLDESVKQLGSAVWGGALYAAVRRGADAALHALGIGASRVVVGALAGGLTAGINFALGKGAEQMTRKKQEQRLQSLARTANISDEQWANFSAEVKRNVQALESFDQETNAHLVAVQKQVDFSDTAEQRIGALINRTLSSVVYLETVDKGDRKAAERDRQQALEEILQSSEGRDAINRVMTRMVKAQLDNVSFDSLEGDEKKRAVLYAQVECERHFNALFADVTGGSFAASQEGKDFLGKIMGGVEKVTGGAVAGVLEASARGAIFGAKASMLSDALGGAVYMATTRFAGGLKKELLKDKERERAEDSVARLLAEGDALLKNNESKSGADIKRMYERAREAQYRKGLKTHELSSLRAMGDALHDLFVKKYIESEVSVESTADVVDRIMDNILAGKDRVEQERQAKKWFGSAGLLQRFGKMTSENKARALKSAVKSAAIGAVGGLAGGAMAGRVMDGFFPAESAPAVIEHTQQAAASIDDSVQGVAQAHVAEQTQQQPQQAVVVPIEQPLVSTAQTFTAEHPLMHALDTQKGDGVTVTHSGDETSVKIALGEKGAFEHLDQALRRVVMDVAHEKGANITEVEAGQMENALANLRELASGHKVAGFAPSEVQGSVSVDGDTLHIDNYEKLADFIQDHLLPHAKEVVTADKGEGAKVAAVDSEGAYKEMAEEQGGTVHFSEVSTQAAVNPVASVAEEGNAPEEQVDWRSYIQSMELKNQFFKEGISEYNLHLYIGAADALGYLADGQITSAEFATLQQVFEVTEELYRVPDDTAKLEMIVGKDNVDKIYNVVTAANDRRILDIGVSLNCDLGSEGDLWQDVLSKTAKWDEHARALEDTVHLRTYEGNHLLKVTASEGVITVSAEKSVLGFEYWYDIGQDMPITTATQMLEKTLQADEEAYTTLYNFYLHGKSGDVTRMGQFNLALDLRANDMASKGDFVDALKDSIKADPMVDTLLGWKGGAKDLYDKFDTLVYEESHKHLYDLAEEKNAAETSLADLVTEYVVKPKVIGSQ